MSSKGKNVSENIAEQKQQHQQPAAGFDRDKVKQEREARRQAKVAAKQKVLDKSRNLSDNLDNSQKSEQKTVAGKAGKSADVATGMVNVAATTETAPAVSKLEISDSDENSDRKKQSRGKGESQRSIIATPDADQIANDLVEMKITDQSKSPVSVTTTTTTMMGATTSAGSLEKPEKKQTTKAERRAKQEASRAAKAAKAVESKATSTAPSVKRSVNDTKSKVTEKPRSGAKENVTPLPVAPKKSHKHRVKLFNHLYPDSALNALDHSNDIHPAIVRLGEQYSSGIVKGCNARGLAFMNAIKTLITEYETPSQKEFARSLEQVIKECGSFLQKYRPLAVSVSNAMKFIQFQLHQLPKTEGDAKEKLLESIDTYVRDQIDKAAEAISITVQQKISDGDVILTYGCSSVILNILNEAKKKKRDFRVIIVDARPWHEGMEMLRRLVAKNINSTCVLINAVGFIMPEVTKVLLGAHSLLANGYVMSRAGTAQISLIAKSYNVPVLVCCETHKFSERVQTDAFVYNEIGDPYDIVKSNENQSPLANWESIPHLTPLNLYYDITPPELVSAVVTEVAILPCTSVPVILRIKPSEIGY